MEKKEIKTFLSRSEQYSIAHNIICDLEQLADKSLTDQLVNRISNYIKMANYKVMSTEILERRRDARLKQLNSP